MKLRNKRRLLNYSRIYNHQLATVLQAAFEEFRSSFAEQGYSLNDSVDALQKLGGSYRHFKRFAVRYVIPR